MQIAWHSGGLPLTQHQLVDFLARAHSVVVLDGFDEVADIETRARVVEEICAAADRLDAHALSLQILVTSRPAAFVNSPRFPEEDWVHLELNDLKWSNIQQYKEKWSVAQDLTDGEKDALTANLEEKLQQPHLRELSRNPMQLAILLQLMHVQGAALPDKRTALYEEYMKIFLNREVEKKQIAADHRELILSIHGLLAWVLQVQAETGQGSGSITAEALRSEVSTYLTNAEHDPRLADSLLTGTVERVGALISRVQGTFEFEVQPLREYFAARHLYKTAPSSPPGREKRGTRPDRFAALAGSSYWTNVTRFYCGFHDEGELPSLVDGLMSLSERDGYNLIAQPRRLAFMLLGDYVFTQSPRSMRRLINFIAQEPDFERLSGTEFGQSQHGMVLPDTAGGRLLFEVCAERLKLEDIEELSSYLRQTMAKNGSVDKRRAFFREAAMGRNGDGRLLSEARDLDLVNELTPEEIATLADGNVSMQMRWLSEANRDDDIIGDARLYEVARREFFHLEFIFLFSRPYRDIPPSSLVVVSEILHPHILSEYFTIWPEHFVGFGRRDFFRQGFLGGRSEDSEVPRQDSFEEFVEFVVELMDVAPEIWRTSLTPWERLVDRGFEEAPNARLFSFVAVISTAVSSVWKKLEGDRERKEGVDVKECLADDRSHGSWDEQGFFPTVGLVRRLYFAKGMGADLEWWRGKIADVDGEAQAIGVAALACWGSGAVITALSKMMSEVLGKLDADQWSWFWNVVSVTMSAGGPQIQKLGQEWFLAQESMSERLAVVLTRRLSDESSRRMVARQCFLGYIGGDRRVLQTAAEWELLSEPYSDIDWDFAKQLSAQARRNGVEHLFSHSHARHRVEVPVEVAEAVLKDCGKHNWQFVSLCERSLGSFVAQGAKKVSTISEEEGWFRGEQYD